MEGVLTALNEMNKDKALHVGGFMTAFWQACWEVVREGVMRMFKDFHNTWRFLRSLKATFLVLILKKNGG